MKAKLALPAHTIAEPNLLLSVRNRYENMIQFLETGNYRLGMMAVMLLIQGNILAPVSLLIYQYYDFGYSDVFAGITVALFFVVLVSNLGLLSVRLCIKLFVANLLLHLAMIAVHFM